MATHAPKFHTFVAELLQASDKLSAKTYERRAVGNEKAARRHWQKALDAYMRAEMLDPEFSAPAWKA